MRWAVAIALGLALGFTGCGAGADPWDQVAGGPPRVLVSFPPLYCFTKSVAGEDCAVLSLLTTIGPHDHKPDKYDALAVKKADLFLVNGLGLDDFVPKIVNSSTNRAVKVVPVAEIALPLGEGKGHRITVQEIKAALPPGQEMPHVHGDFDPHAWLGIDEAIRMVEKICEELQQLDPPRKSRYGERAAAYIQKLRDLQAEGIKLLEDKKNKSILAQHDSLKYFARSFGLKVVGTLQAQPGIDPDAVALDELRKKCRRGEVQVIAIEPQYNKAAAERIQASARADNPDVALVIIDPLETAAREDLDAGYYERTMRANLLALAKHLK